MSVTVLNEQTLLDVAIQEYGGIERSVALGFANGQSATEILEVGQELELPALDVDEQVANHFKIRNAKPATAMTTAQEAITDNEDPCDLCKCFT